MYVKTEAQRAAQSHIEQGRLMHCNAGTCEHNTTQHIRSISISISVSSHHLQILGSGGGVDGSGSGADIEDNGVLDKGDAEVSSLANDELLDTAIQLVEDNSTPATIHCGQRFSYVL
jgi:hypothetical protein